MMHPGSQPPRSRSERARTRASCRPAGLWTLRELIQKFVDAAVAQWVHDQVSQRIRRDANDIGSRHGAFRKLNGGTGRSRHHIAFLLAGIECILDLSEYRRARLAIILELVEGYPNCGSPRLRGYDRLSSAEDVRRSRDHNLRRQSRYRNDAV